MNFEQKIAELEALLFIHGEPLTNKKAEKILELGKEDFEALVSELDKRLAAEGRGIALVRDGEKLQFATKPQFAKLVEGFVKEEMSEDLTPATLEVLSIIAYLSPVTRSEIDYRRGVNSSFTLRNLMLRGLVERYPDPERPSSLLYRPTFEFFKHLGAKGKEELPDFEKFRAALTISQTEGQQEAQKENTQ
ncbi:MAG TPA: SMC-Scp complex subunit ScpB [Candidatus Paceibacterota bacterium]|nr:SMC-Scp complex subunit ScpB [Candidatus Paceibacterota bacterium]